MEYRRLGGSGFSVPVLSFGTGTFGGKGELFAAWGATDVKEASRLIDICLEAGLTMFDSADIYSSGAAEEILGAALKGRRNEALISTKASFRSGEGPNDVGSSRFHLLEAVEGALRRLQTDHIDLFQLHGFRRADAGRGDPVGAGRSRSRRKNPLCRLLEFFRLAPYEIARRRGPLQSAPPCSASSLLFPHRPRLRG